jgi:hypothetical protein
MGFGARASTKGKAERQTSASSKLVATPGSRPAEAWRLDETVHKAAETEGDEQCAQEIESLGGGP